MPAPTTASIPDFRLIINNTPVPKEMLMDLMSISVNEALDAPGMFTLQLYTWDADQLAFNWVDDALFEVGNEVEIQLGYLNDLASVIIGEITGLDLTLSGGDIPTLTVRGYDLSQRLLRNRKTRTFTNKTVSSIASQIASDLGLEVTVEDTEVVRDSLLQDRVTDMEFLLKLAKPLDYEVKVVGRRFYFQPKVVADPAAVTLTLQDNLLEFSAQLSIVQQVDQVQVRGWDVNEKKAILSTIGSTATVDNPVVFTSDDNPETQAEADQLAQGHWDALSQDYIKGEGATLGRTDLHVGMVVKLDEIGTRFSGDYYLTNVTHSLSHGQGYRTQFSAQRKKS